MIDRITCTLTDDCRKKTPLKIAIEKGRNECVRERVVTLMVVELNPSTSALDELAVGMKRHLRFPKLSPPWLLAFLFFAGSSLDDGRFFARVERPGDFSTALSKQFGFDFIRARK